jgi:HEAT repeat protein
VTALAQLLGDKKALVPVLVSAMVPSADQLQDRFVRCQAIHALGQLGKELGSERKTAIGNLRRCLTDKLSEVKLAAALTLGELGAEVIGEDAPAIISELQVLKKSPEKPIAEAAEAAIKRLEKKP